MNVPRCFGTLLLLVVFPGSAFAHNLGAECSLKNGKVHVEAYFDDDTPAVAAKVEVLDGQEKLIVTGQTDARGLWSFAAPNPGKYHLIVNAGPGHRAKVSLSVPEPVAPISTQEATISEGPGRKEFTQFPLFKVSLGLGTILLFSVAFLIARRKTGPARTE